MPSNEELAAALLEDARYSLQEARLALRRGFYHRAVRRSQECVELALKAVLRLFGHEYPKAHDVAVGLTDIGPQLPPSVRRQIPRIMKVSTTLALKRGPAFYGDELRGVAARRLFHRPDAVRAVRGSEQVLQYAEAVQKAWQRARGRQP